MTFFLHKIQNFLKAPPFWNFGASASFTILLAKGIPKSASFAQKRHIWSHCWKEKSQRKTTGIVRTPFKTGAMDLSLGNLNFHIMQLFTNFRRYCRRRDPIWPVHTVFEWIPCILVHKPIVLKFNYYNRKICFFVSFLRGRQRFWWSKPICTGC